MSPLIAGSFLGPLLFQLRDFLLVYNRMTELCFQRCVPSLHHRALDAEEVGDRVGSYYSSSSELTADCLPPPPTSLKPLAESFVDPHP